MTDPLVQRMTAKEIESAAERLALHAERLAESARLYAAELTAGGGHARGDASRLCQEAGEVLKQAAYLDGMRNIAQLIPDDNDQRGSRP